MTSKDFLRLHLSVLLAQHGEHAVVEGVASLVGTPQEELLARLDDLQKLGHARQKKGSPTVKPGETVEALLANHPDKAELLRKIQARFVNRTYLPELKDVRRFLDRHGQPSSSLKKRDDSFVKVVRQLVLLQKDELEAILAAPAESGYSSLGVISDQILGRK